jgi:hypothetical protein
MGQTRERERDSVQLETPLKKWTPHWLDHQILTLGVLKYNVRICWKFQANNYYKNSASRTSVSNYKTQTWWCWLLYSRDLAQEILVMLLVQTKTRLVPITPSSISDPQFHSKNHTTGYYFSIHRKIGHWQSQYSSLSLSLLFLIELSILILFVKSIFQSERSPSYMQRWWNPWCHDCA